MPEVLPAPPALLVTSAARDSPKPSKRRWLKFSPSLRKRSGSKEHAVMAAGDSGGSRSNDLYLHLPNGLKESEKKELVSIFEMFDKNRDGKISCDELGVVLRTMGHHYSQQEVEQMIRHADKNDNGYVEYDEFLLLMKRWSAATAEKGEEDSGSLEAEEAREAFRIFDMDGNGYIDRHELRFIMSRLGESPGEEDICQMFRLADLNGDGLIDYDEFTHLMASMTLQGGSAPSSSTSAKASPRSTKASPRGSKKH